MSEKPDNNEREITDEYLVWMMQQAASFEPDYDYTDDEDGDWDAARERVDCPYCGGVGMEDDSSPCPHCDGEGFKWWL